MAGEAAGEKLGRLVERAAETGDGLWARARGVRRRGGGVARPNGLPGSSADQPGDSQTGADTVEPDLIDVDLSNAVARAEAAEAEVARLRAELARKEEILAEARIALRTARLALRDHLRITQP